MASDSRPKVHISLSEATHRRLRVKCAVDNITIQHYVEGLIEEGLKTFTVPEGLARDARTTTKDRK